MSFSVTLVLLMPSEFVKEQMFSAIAFVSKHIIGSVD